jgi:hypothetical protein
MALAGSIDAPASSGNQGADTLPPSDLSGWFFNGSSDGLFPFFPDPSQTWTSAENLATINSWASLVAATEGDPELLAQLVGLGMTGSPDPSVSPLNLSLSQDSGGVTPEPALLGMLGGGIAVLGFYAIARGRRFV